MSPIVPLYTSYYLLLIIGVLAAIAGHSGKDIFPKISSSEHKKSLLWVGWSLFSLSFVVGWSAISIHGSPMDLGMITCLIMAISFMAGPTLIMQAAEDLQKSLDAQST